MTVDTGQAAAGVHCLGGDVSTVRCACCLAGCSADVTNNLRVYSDVLFRCQSHPDLDWTLSLERFVCSSSSQLLPRMLAPAPVQSSTLRYSHIAVRIVCRRGLFRPAAAKQHQQQQQQCARPQHLPLHPQYKHPTPTMATSASPAAAAAAAAADSPASAPAGIKVVGPDHIVLRVADPVASVAWYFSKLGLQPVRLQEYQDGKVPFPSVRVSPTFLIDFMKQKPADAEQQQHEPQAAAAGTSKTSGSAAPANLDHLCLVVGGDDIEDVKQRLAALGVQAEQQFDGVVVKRFGAQGNALSIYVRDPDSNVVELRTYGGQASS